MSLLMWVVAGVWMLLLANSILNLRLVPHLVDDARVAGGESTLLVSVIIPARDEAGSIEETVRGFAAQTWPSIEIVVVDDRSSDATAAIVAGLANEYPNVRLIHGSEPAVGWLGKPWALAQGAAAAQGAILLFADADVHYEPKAVECAVRILNATGVGAVSLFPHFDMRGFWESILMPELTFLAFVIAPLWLSNRTRHPFLAVGGGPGNLVRREDYDRIGGHAELRDAVVDDIALVRLLRRDGHRTIAVRAERMVSIRMYRGLREVVRGFTKNAFKSMDVGIPGVIVALLLIIAGHLLPYALAIAGGLEWLVHGRILHSLLPAVLSILLITIVRTLLFAEFRYPAGYAIAGHPMMMAGWLWIVARSTWITGVKKELQWRGRSYDAAGTTFGGKSRVTSGSPTDNERGEQTRR